jgi:peptidoglycan/LPS O-acetylase OafA/YrhL
MPFAHFWFLQATFVIMATFVALSALSGGRSTVVAAAMMCLGAGSWVLGAVPNYNVFSVIQALYLMPFFMCGYLCNRIGLAKMDGVLAALILGGLGLIGYLLAVGSVSVDPTLRRAIAVLCGLVFCMTLLSVRPQNRFLARLGAMSYAIYLFHVFFTAGMREVLMHMWPQTPLALIWLICLVAGVTGPIVLYHIVTRNSLISLTVLGIMPRRKAGRTLWRSAPAMGLGKA